MLDPERRRWIAGDRESIHPKGPSADELAVRGPPLPGELMQAVELLRADRLERMPEGGSAAGLDLDDGDGLGIRHDQIDLTAAASPVTVEDREATAAKVRLRGAFTRPAEVVLACHSPSVTAPAGAASANRV